VNEESDSISGGDSFDLMIEIEEGSDEDGSESE